MAAPGRKVVFALLATFSAMAQEQALRQAAKLDSEGKCLEAERIYQAALAKNAASAILLNNAGNHYLTCGQPDKAQALFEDLLKLNPSAQNANLQLGRLAVERKEGEAALQYLSKVKDAGPAVAIVRAEALYQAGRKDQALQALSSIQAGAKNDPRVLFTLGLAAARMNSFDMAEGAFAAVAAQVPADFDVLYNLGRAALQAGHHQRAVNALEASLRVRPKDSGALLALGQACAGAHDFNRAVYVLAQARQQAPKNPEVLLALAHASQDAGFHGDAALVYDEYLALKPGDDRARLERARAYASNVARRGEALKDTEWYVKKHPADSIGYFYLAQLNWEKDPAAALDQLTKAISLDPANAPVLYARAWLLQRQGRLEESLPDLQATAKLTPRSARALDQLGLAYLALDRPKEAETTLKAALEVDPNDREILMHVGRALVALDRETEAQQFFDRFRQSPVRQAKDPRSEAGMIALATQPEAQLRQSQIDRLRKDAAEHPSQPELQLKLGELLLADAKLEEAQAAFRELATRNADAPVWEEAGTCLMQAGQYEVAVEFLKRAAVTKPAANLELAMALYLSLHHKEALQAIEQTPESARAGDYYLLKARLLDASGRNDEAEQALQAGLKLAVTGPQVAQQAVMHLLSRNREEEALALIDRAIRASPGNADLALIRPVLSGVMGRTSEAEKGLKEVEMRWPEWDRPYFAHALLLEAAGRKSEAKRKLQTAAVLNPEAAASRCWTELRQMLFPGCKKQ